MDFTEFSQAFPILLSRFWDLRIKNVEADEKARGRYSFTAICCFKQVLSLSNQSYFHLSFYVIALLKIVRVKPLQKTSYYFFPSKLKFI